MPIDDILKRSTYVLVHGVVKLLSGQRLTDFEYADDIALLASNVQTAHFLNRLTMEMIGYGMQFVRSEFGFLIQDWQEFVFALSSANEKSEEC